MKYAEELTKAMTWLGQRPDTLFLGQAVAFAGTAMTNTLSGVPNNRKLELPVIEEAQMGITNGLAINGIATISIFPRWNFLLLAANQIVNHADKLTTLGWSPKIIIRTSIGATNPMHPGIQHVGDFTEAFRSMCPHINIQRLEEPESILPEYQRAYALPSVSILVEYGNYYNDK